MAAERDNSTRAAVVVPSSAGPIVPLSSVSRGRDDIDDLLDDLFGEPDDEGPGIADAGLLVGGVGALAVGQLADLSGIVTAGGIGAIVLGAILPTRSLFRRLAHHRRERRIRALLGDGVFLRVDHPKIRQLIQLHDSVLESCAHRTASIAERATAVAHDMVREVASLLKGERLSDPAEEQYVSERVTALELVVQTLADPTLDLRDDPDLDRRRAAVAARREVEQLSGGSALTDAAALVAELNEPSD